MLLMYVYGEYIKCIHYMVYTLHFDLWHQSVTKGDITVFENIRNQVCHRIKIKSNKKKTFLEFF